MEIPSYVKSVLNTIESHGKEAYLVGGCVRDYLMGIPPHDFDVTTSALPEEIISYFPKTIPTGEKHGTITVREEHQSIEVTTFRTETTYGDHRHPDEVQFTTSLKEDCQRRDFTMNALAMDQEGKIWDFYGGQEDLKNHVIRCVGDPNERFSEDALRIMRAIRFSSVLGFAIEENTAKAIHQCKDDLLQVSSERVRDELVKLLVGKNVGQILRDYWDVLGVVVPELLPAVGFPQRNKHHLYDVWEHTIVAMESIPADPILRLVILFHDLGKPDSYTESAMGVSHFYGHHIRSEELGRQAMKRLRFSHDEIEEVSLLILWHDCRFEPTRSSTRRMLDRLGEEKLKKLLVIQDADNLAHNPKYDCSAIIKARSEMVDTILRDKDTFSLKQLTVNGKDMMALGYEGADIGITLQRLLFEVIEDRLPNEKDALISYAKKIQRKQ